jgi:hypothetical protein
MKRKTIVGLILVMLFLVSVFPLNILSGVVVRADSDHDVAVTGIASSKTVVGEGFSDNIGVTAANQGSYSETFDVTAYCSLTSELGLVGYWNLDEGSGTIAYDSSGYNNHGTIYGASWTSGKVNSALNFDGLNDYVDCGNSATLDPIQGATIEAWVNFRKLPSAAGHIMAIAGRSFSGADLDLQTEPDNRFKFYIGPGAAGGYVAISNTVAQADKWYHVVGTYQGNSNIKIYVNGTLEKTTSISIARNHNSGTFCIGASPYWGGRFLNGTIDEVKIYNRALSAEEIGTEYTGTGKRFFSQTQSVTFEAGASAPVTFTWNTSGFVKGNYTISAYAHPIPSETDTTDNTYTNGLVTVVTPGDVNADGVVDIFDAAAISAHWYPGPPSGPLGYGPNFDINGDGAIGILDAAIVSAYWTGPPKGPLAP